MAKEFTSDSFESATSLQAAPASASFGNHHWYPLPEKLEALLGVVPESSAVLERTTVLTWLYQNKGVMAFEEVAFRVGGERTITVKKKLARRALRGLAKIGAVTLMELQGSAAASDADTGGQDEQADEGEACIGRNTVILITTDGMLWMRRAWHARAVSLDAKEAMLLWVHNVFLQEEEEGKGNEPFWIEKLNCPESRDSHLPAGEVSKWISTPVTSVFDLSRVHVKSSARGQRRRAAAY